MIELFLSQNLKAIEENRKIKNEEKTCLENEIDQLSGIEIKNQELKQDLQFFLNEINEKNREYDDKIVSFKGIKEKINNLKYELDILIEKTEFNLEENAKEEKLIDSLRTEIDDVIEKNKER